MALHPKTQELMKTRSMEGFVVLDACEEAAMSGLPVYVRHEQREGWSAPLPIYMLYCPGCRDFTDTHPAGNSPRIPCQSCSYAVFLPKSELVKRSWLPRAAFWILTAGVILAWFLATRRR